MVVFNTYSRLEGIRPLQIILKTFVPCFMTVYVPEGWNALNVTMPLNAFLVSMV